MGLFTRDIKRRVLQYLPGYENNGLAQWQSLTGEFFEASKERLEESLDVFHARDFDEIAPYLAAQNLIHDIMDVSLDHGVITPSGAYYGLRKNVTLEDFVEALKTIKDRLPKELEKQIHCYGIGTPWLEVRKGFGTSIPFGSSEAQIQTLEKIGYKNGDQINGPKKLYNDAFPVQEVRNYWVPDNPDFSDLTDVCFDLWNEWDAFVKNNKAANGIVEIIGRENGYSIY